MKYLRLLWFSLPLFAWLGCKSTKPTTAERPLRSPEPAAAAKSTGNPQLDYVQRYKDIAIAEMQRTGIPASIKLAQGILESGSGRSELAVNANNHFGIKCAGTWTGRTYYKKDDERDASGNPIESCFRRYERPDESFFDHSEFIRDPRRAARYGFLFNLDPTDYRGWARGLQTAGYATSPTYADRLIELIENLRLYEYDQPGAVVAPPPGGVVPERVPPKERIQYVNDVKVVHSRPGETIADIARIYQLNPSDVADYNDRLFAPGDRLPVGTRIFIQPKRRSWRGRTTHHFVRTGQTMLDIAQQYGIQLEALLERNGMTYGQEPMVNEKIRLRGRRQAGEVVRLRDGGTPQPPRPTPPPPLTPDERPPFERPDTAKAPSTPAPLPDRPVVVGVPYPTDPIPEPAPQPRPPASQTPQPQWPNPTPPAPQTPPTPQPQAVFHRVERGDTLFSLSRRYGISVAELKRINQLTSDQIKIGQVLRIQ
ncbi:MAG: LysM peptidoglycan-binding domain-containing protein [Saprospiraceae bacterium]|nr:LysM peptidoglycan-binding domain-containing protein [Saprospiraceae bacterium]